MNFVESHQGGDVSENNQRIGSGIGKLHRSDGFLSWRWFHCDLTGDTHLSQAVANHNSKHVFKIHTECIREGSIDINEKLNEVNKEIII